MTYVLLAGAIIAEILGTMLLKQTEGFTKLLPTVGTLALYGIAFFLLAQTLIRGLNIGIAYATWSGVGIALITAFGIHFLGEALSPAKFAGMALVIAGVVTLNLSGAH